MATSLLQVRVEDSLKDQAAVVFENLGNGIPFKMTLPKTPYAAERGYRAMVEMSESAEKNGLSDMTLDEINAEIDASRKERQTASK